MSKATEQLRELSKQRTKEVLNQPGSIQRFAPSPLAQINPAFARTTSFLPSSVANPFAGALQYQRAPGANYLNYETMGQNVGGPLLQPQPPANFVPPGTQPEVIRQYPDGTPVGDEEDESPLSASDKALERINEMRIAQGQEPFESMAEFQADLRRQIGIGSEGGGFNPFGGMAGMSPMYAAEGGIASLDPMYMNEGGIMSALSNIASNIGQGVKNFGTGMKENFQANMAGTGPLNRPMGDKRLEDMTREELLNYIKSGQKPNEAGGGIGSISFTDLFKGRPQGGTAALNQMGDLSQLEMSEGGDVDFPRMNGPISGPGTETSDDIPAMLSDGEFVVNAKAVRGIGRLEGAGKSKEEQRREGARMMYALQRAGEKAMRKA